MELIEEEIRNKDTEIIISSVLLLSFSGKKKENNELEWDVGVRLKKDLMGVNRVCFMLMRIINNNVDKCRTDFARK